MAAYPFGGHPLFAQYIAWAIEQGCSVQSGIITDSRGRPHAITRIVAPDGNWVIEATDQKEYLAPSAVSRLDRRLGLKSTFAGLPGNGTLD